MLIRLRKLTADAAIAEPPYKAPITDEWVGEFVPISWSIKREQDTTGSWSFSVPLTLHYVKELKNYSRAFFYLDGVEVMHGLVDDVQYAFEGGKIVYNVSGLGEVAELDRELSANFTHYANVQVVVVLQELLRWTGWRLGDFSTMKTLDVRTSLDLRERETVLQQVQTVCESVPGLHYRWGGYNCYGKPTLDVGFFDTIQDVYLTQAEPHGLVQSPDRNNGYVLSAQVQQTYTNLISEVHGNGGTYNTAADPDKHYAMTLWHVNEALTVFPAYVNADYPLVIDGNGFFRVRNLALYPAGSSIRKTWDHIATKNADPPTVTEILLVALSLYQKCIRFLEEHAYSSNTYSLNIAGLSQFPYPGDRVQINITALNYAIAGGGSLPIEGETLQGDYRVGSWNMDSKGDSYSLTANVTEHEYIGTVDPDDDIILIAKSREDYDIKGRAGGNLCGDYAITVAQDSFVDVAGPGNPADCSLCEHEDAILITVDFAVPFVAPDNVRVMGIIPDPLIPFEWELVQAPTVVGGLPGDPAIICFRFRDHPWTVADTVSLTTYMRFWG